MPSSCRRVVMRCEVEKNQVGMEPDDRLDQRIIEPAGFRQRLDRLGPVRIAVSRHQAPALAERTHGFRQARKQADNPLRRTRQRDLMMQIVARHDGRGGRELRRGGAARGSGGGDGEREAASGREGRNDAGDAHRRRTGLSRPTAFIVISTSAQPPRALRYRGRIMVGRSTRETGAKSPVPHRSRPPQRVPSRRRSVYGLVNRASRPSRLPARDHAVAQRLALFTYRCGGSVGLIPEDLTDFPFHPSAARPMDS